MPKKSPEDKSFTVTEVGVLIEGFRSDVGIIAEKVDGLAERMDRVEERLTNVEADVRSIKDVLCVAIPDLTKRVARLESKVG